MSIIRDRGNDFFLPIGTATATTSTAVTGPVTTPPFVFPSPVITIDQTPVFGGTGGDFLTVGAGKNVEQVAPGISGHFGG